MRKLDAEQFRGQSSKKRLAIFVVFLVLLTSIFWSTSRVPQLDEKALMGDRSEISSLAFNPVMVPTADDGPVFRLVAATVNWYETNWKGMTFGLLLAGTFLSILVLVSATSSRSVFVNALAGMFIGAPLGICANCTAPVAKSLDDGGGRLETTLATLFSSPTLNIIVVTMLFTLFPLPVALLKMALTFFLILAAVPLLTRFVFGRENAGREVGNFSCSLPENPLKESWFQATKGALVIWLKCFWFIVVTAVPFMLLAGFLGAIAIELTPTDALASFDFTWWGAIGLAALGTFLPVPIAFDVIFSSVMMSAGLHMGYVMILLFTLGPFSIYPFLLLGRSISFRVVNVFFITIMAIGMTGGYALHSYNLVQRSQIVSAAGTPEIGPIIEETCGDLSNNPSACADLSWSRVSALMPRVKKACASIVDPDSRKACRRFERGRLLFNSPTAMASQMDGCISKGNASRGCLLRMTQALVSYLGNERIDDSASSTEKKMAHNSISLQSACRDEFCADPVIVFQSLYLHDPELCQNISEPRLRGNCRSRAEQWMAKTSGGPQACLSDSIAERAACIASHPGQPQELIEVCSQLPDDSEIESCELKLLRFEGVLTSNDPCSRMSSQRGRTECLVAVEQSEQWARAGKPGLLLRTARTILNPGTDFDVDLVALLAESSAPDPQVLNSEPSLVVESEPFLNEDGISVSFSEFFTPGLPGENGALFQSLPTNQVGIETPFSFFEQGTTASGDYDGDGWIDVVMSDISGLRLYRNLGALKFVPAPLSYDPEFYFPYGLVGFVDIDNDGDLDIFQAGEAQLIFYLNEGGGFANAQVLPVGPLLGNPIAVPFADVNADGLLDVFLGFREINAPNRLLMNEGAVFRDNPHYEDRFRGKTYGVLFSDLNSDGHTDLFVGNDFDKSDEVFFGTLDGSLSRVSASSGLLAGVSTFNMGYDSGDINNDLRLDVFSPEAEMVEGVVPRDPCANASWSEEFLAVCREYYDTYQKALRSGGVERCQQLSIDSWKARCAISKITKVARATRDPSVCEVLPAMPAYLRRSCLDASKPAPTVSHAGHFSDDLPQFHRNALHVQDTDGTFQEKSEEYGVSKAFWAWNARIHDYDNDGWQDIFVVNGRGAELGGFAADLTPNVFFKNMGGTGFESWGERYGLGELFQSRSYVAEDFDLDGDIDILAQAIRAPYRLYVNGSAALSDRNALEINIVDRKMNHFGIGTQVIVHYAGGAQIREVKSAGGFQSHNSPVLHFGLGPVTAVDRIEVRWTDGTVTDLEGEFFANRIYTIERQAEAGLAYRD